MDPRASTRLVGLLGHPVEHSLSPVMHNAVFQGLDLDFCYLAFDVLPEEVEGAVRAVRALSMVGVNVTVPHKEAVIDHLDEVSPAAGFLRSVNTIVHREGRLVGHTTDGPGFVQSLRDEGIDPAGREVLMVGGGGAARAILYALAEAGARSLTIAILPFERERMEGFGQALAERFPPLKVGVEVLETPGVADALARASLLVHATPVGMWPEVEALPPIPVEVLGPDHVVYDIVYNPPKTLLRRLAEERGATTVGGLGMLVHQGALSLQMWIGQPPSRTAPIMAEAARAFLRGA